MTDTVIASVEFTQAENRYRVEKYRCGDGRIEYSLRDANGNFDVEIAHVFAIPTPDEYAALYALLEAE